MKEDVNKKVYLILLNAGAGMTYHDIYAKIGDTSISAMNDALRYLLGQKVVMYIQADDLSFGMYRLNQ